MMTQSYISSGVILNKQAPPPIHIPLSVLVAAIAITLMVYNIVRSYRRKHSADVKPAEGIGSAITSLIIIAIFIMAYAVINTGSAMYPENGIRTTKVTLTPDKTIQHDVLTQYNVTISQAYIQQIKALTTHDPGNVCADAGHTLCTIQNGQLVVPAIRDKQSVKCVVTVKQFVPSTAFLDCK